MKPILLLFFSATLLPATVIVSHDVTFAENATIPDLSGDLFSRTITGTDIGSITSLKVTLNFSGGWNGDLYAYVAHSSGFSVLLNRIGRDGLGSDAGSDSSGMTVTFDDAGVDGDIHTGVFMSGQLVTGVFAPDGREVAPNLVTNNSERTAFLSSFYGLAGDGLWELFIADLSGGETSQLLSWGLSMEGRSISNPDPVTNSFAQWIGVGGFGLTGGDAVFDFDFDNDGVSNGEEWYFFGTNPKLAQSHGSPLAEVTASGSGSFTFRHSRPVTSIGVTAEYEWSTLLNGTWSASGATAEGVTIIIGAIPDSPDLNTAPDYESVTVTVIADSTTAPKVFVRMKLVSGAL